MNGARSFTGEQKENKKSSGAKQMRPEPAIRAASFVDPSRLPARRFKRSGTTVAVRQRSNCLRSATFTVTVAELWFENHNSATSATANGPPQLNRAGTWRRPQCPGNQHHAHARFQFPPAIHPRESPVCRWLGRKPRSARLGRSHVFGDSTLRHHYASRNRKTFRACAETVDDQTSLWKPEEKCADSPNAGDFRRARIRDYGACLTFSRWCATVYEHERSSGGLMKRHEERFPSAIHQNRKCGLKCRGSCCLTPVVGICFSATTTRKPKRWSSTATIVFGDANGNVSRQGCAIATGTRY